MVSKAKGEVATRDASPKKKSAKEASTSRTYRKSPARTDRRSSPGRTTTSPSASPSRRSPSRRSPSRRSPIHKDVLHTKSPARKTSTPKRTDTSPVKRDQPRRSPGRPRKIDNPIQDAPVEKFKSSIRTRKQAMELDSDSDIDLYRSINIEKPKAEVKGHARMLENEFTLPKVILQDIKSIDNTDKHIAAYVGLTRRSLLKPRSHEIDHVVHLKQNESSIQRLTEFSDEDEVPVRKSLIRENSERHSEPKIFENRIVKPEFGGWIGTLFMMIALPPTLIGLYLLCDENNCSFTKIPNFQKYKFFSTYIDTTAILIFSGFVLLMAILSALPFTGSQICGLPNKQGKLTYRMNAPFVTITAGIIIIILEFFDIQISSFVLQKYFSLLISSIIIGTLLAICLYIHSYFVSISALNPYTITNSKIYNFCVGRELHPRIFGTDVKVLNLRIFYIGTILLNSMYIYESIEFISSEEASHIFDWRITKCNCSLLVSASLLIFYGLDYVIFERTFITSFSIQHEAVGYLTTILNYIAIFAVSYSSKHLYEYNVTLPSWQLALLVALFFIGYFLYRGSNSQKDAFRQNPYNPTLSHLESIPTSQGKKLLVSGFWGFVRHPNYLGDILIHISLAIFVITKPPVLFYIIDILYLIHRSYRDGVRCKERYGTAWDRYCQRVKYVLLPKFY